MLALGCCFLLQLLQISVGSDAQNECAKQDMHAFEMNFYNVVQGTVVSGKQDMPPIFSDAAKCVALERKALQQKGASKETRKSLKNESNCWKRVISQATNTSATSTSALRAADGTKVPLPSFWQSKRLEILRDHTALSSVGALQYRSRLLGIVNDSNIDAHIKLMEKGLSDPAFSCQSRWWYAFDRRHNLLARSLWKRYAELLVVMQSYGSQRTKDVFDIASSLPDNLQQWQTPQALHAQLPGLRAAPVWDKSEFPWLLRLEKHFSEVKHELLNAIQTTGLIRHQDDFFYDDSDDWKFLALLLNGQWNEPVCQHLTPITCGLIQNRSEFDSVHLKLPDAVQSASAEGDFQFKKSVAMVKIYNLKPGAYLRPHFGSHGRLAAHLGLVVPKNCCSLVVGGQEMAWEEGKIVVFDDSFVHEARNTGDHERLVLGIFFVHPDLQDPGNHRAEL